MPAALKRSAIHLLALSIAFCVFFYASKHLPALNRNNPFVEDPYDAVGSFAIQLAVFLSGLSLLRAFRPYPDGMDMASQRQLVVAGQRTGSMAVIVTLVADVVALCRHPERWSQSSPSALLLGLTAGLLGWAAISFASGFHRQRGSGVGRMELWRPAFAWFLGAMAVVAFYPERFRHTLPGAIATVVVGALVLFIPLWKFALAAAPRPAASVAGLGSDLASVGQSVWARIRGRSEAGANATGVGSVSPSAPAWLTPGRLWIGICLCGVLIGCALAGAELREGSSAVLAKRLLILAVYAGLETAAMLLGFALLRRPLRLSVI